MSIRLDHTIVPARDRLLSAHFLADLLDLPVDEHNGPFAAVTVNETLTLDFEQASDFEPHHYAFLVSGDLFDSVLAKIRSAGIAFGSGPHSGFDGQLYFERGRRGFYFRDPNRHMYELIAPAE